MLQFTKPYYEKAKSYQTEQEQHFHSLYSRTKSRAKRKSWEFDLTLEWLKEKYNKRICEATGIPFSLEKIENPNDSEALIKRPFAPSIDRIDSTKGYTQSNCQLVTWQYNQMKYLWSHKELIKFCRAVLIAEAAKKIQVSN